MACLVVGIHRATAATAMRSPHSGAHSQRMFWMGEVGERMRSRLPGVYFRRLILTHYTILLLFGKVEPSTRRLRVFITHSTHITSTRAVFNAKPASIRKPVESVIESLVLVRTTVLPVVAQQSTHSASPVIQYSSVIVQVCLQVT